MLLFNTDLLISLVRLTFYSTLEHIDETVSSHYTFQLDAFNQSTQ